MHRLWVASRLTSSFGKIIISLTTGLVHVELNATKNERFKHVCHYNLTNYFVRVKFVYLQGKIRRRNETNFNDHALPRTVAPMFLFFFFLLQYACRLAYIFLIFRYVLYMLESESNSLFGMHKLGQ